MNFNHGGYLMQVHTCLGGGGGVIGFNDQLI